MVFQCLGSAIPNVQKLSICCLLALGVGVINHSRCSEYHLLGCCVSLHGDATGKTSSSFGESGE